ncbi:hypothetical protein GCM10011514_49540 [Emticicia aquatilis]|uniref:NRDE family protein n=1 Tax=Emticicia aquatilis TaxID=1537369 RepID=A0A917DYT0_9BACT|nr:NRDE family protein [Emticicia aquatilis]GGD79653.1 hypothetical protein GCM10011514_49540 [Emticicia aquatilis]
MCTVVFIPNKKGGYFASLRDESPKRAAAFAPTITKKNGVKYLAPIDSLAGGTWIGLSELGNVIILLNGGFETHTKENHYLKSRGLIVSELLSSEMPVIDWQLMDLAHIEPFTLILWSENLLFQLVWDGKTKHRIRLDTSLAHLFSSATLYNNESKAKREDLFTNWLAMKPPITKLSLLHFFQSFDDKQNGFIINRNDDMKTLSYSFIELNENELMMSYYDLERYIYCTEILPQLTKIETLN